jgi:hypothetical protein
MKNSKIKEDPLRIYEREVDVLEEELDEREVKPEEERQTTVHCKMYLEAGMAVRIWKSTFLVEKESGQKRQLLHNINIPIAPTWLLLEKTGWHHFTLLFEGLNKDCQIFDMKEIIPESGGFEVLSIKRNNSDVYSVQVD